MNIEITWAFRKIKLYSFDIIIAISMICDETGTEIITDDPYSVNKIPELDELYLELIFKADEPEVLELPLESKWKICEKIFGQNMVSSKPGNETLQDPVKVEETLKKDYRYIFDDIFDRQISDGSSQREFYRYTNRSKERKILANGNQFVERVFTCLVLEHQSSLLKQYFVSVNDYDVNEALDGDYIVGRFVFAFHPNIEDTLVVYALAEEYAKSQKGATTTQIEELYVRKRDQYLPAQNPDDDPICKLSAGNKLRLCTSLFQCWSWAPCEVVVEECAQQEFSIQTNNRTYQEWMLTCRTIGLINITAKVSRGYNDNEVFTFQTYNRGLGVLSHFRNVAMVLDTPTLNVCDDSKLKYTDRFNCLVESLQCFHQLHLFNCTYLYNVKMIIRQKFGPQCSQRFI